MSSVMEMLIKRLLALKLTLVHHPLQVWERPSFYQLRIPCIVDVHNLHM